MLASVRAAERLRLELGNDIELLFDAHTMFSPIETVQLANMLEPYRLFFYEDPVRPFNGQSLRLVRQKTNLPLATGEQFSHKWEFQPLIEEELIDYLRIDVAHAGGYHGGEEDSRLGRDPWTAVRLAPRELADQWDRLPAHRLRDSELRNPGME